MSSDRFRFPRPLRRGDVIGVTSPASVVPPQWELRLDACIEHLRRRGYEVHEGRCVRGERASATERAAELQAMMMDPEIQAVVPPAGGYGSVEVLPLLDFEAIAESAPTWFVGWSDVSILTAALTLRTATATVHGGSVFEALNIVPPPLADWLTACETESRSVLHRAASNRHSSNGLPLDEWADHPAMREVPTDSETAWRVMGGAEGEGEVHVTGRLIGNLMGMLPGTPFGDVAGFADRYAPEGLLLYLEVVDFDPYEAAHMLHHFRLAGWFDDANAVLVGRPLAPEADDYTHDQALTDALSTLDIPVVTHVDIGHLVPQLAIVNGALATLDVTTNESSLVQQL